MNAEQFSNTLQGIGFTELRVPSESATYFSWGTNDDGVFVSLSRNNQWVFSYWSYTQGGHRSVSENLRDYRHDLGAIVLAISEIVNSPARKQHLPVAAMAHN